MSGAYAYMLDTNAASTLIRGRAVPALQKLLLAELSGFAGYELIK